MVKKLVALVNDTLYDCPRPIAGRLMALVPSLTPAMPVSEEQALRDRVVLLKDIEQIFEGNRGYNLSLIIGRVY